MNAIKRFLGFLLAGMSGFVSASTIYVDSAATGAGDGTSWADAYTTIQAAVNDSAFPNGTIEVAGGVYTEAVTIGAAQSGMPATPSRIVAKAGETPVLDGGGTLLNGTGSEDYLNQAWGMQDNAFQRNGSSVFEGRTTIVPSITPWDQGGYQTSYVFNIENPVRFQKEIKVTIEHGHGNHLANEMSSVGYWYAEKPAQIGRASCRERV